VSGIKAKNLYTPVENMITPATIMRAMKNGTHAVSRQDPSGQDPAAMSLHLIASIDPSGQKYP
jgi:hypothetical protein